jgi:hypothetical protein
MVNVKTGNIMRFDREYFESVLPVGKVSGKILWKRGFYQGEWAYLINMGDPNDVKLYVRSSIGEDDFSGGSGEDSIRILLVHGNDPRAVIASKVTHHVTRRPGWEQRMREQFSTLRQWRIAAGDCKVCSAPRNIRKVKKAGQNKGRIFAQHCKADDFVWVT